MQREQKQPRLHILFVRAITVIGIVSLAIGLAGWHPPNPVRSASFILLAVLASCLPVSRPRIPGTMSISFIFILIALMEMTLGGALFLGCAIAAIQYLIPKANRSHPTGALFHIGHTAIAIQVCHYVFRADLLARGGVLLDLGLAATVLYVMNTVPVSVGVSLAERRSLPAVWRECNFWTFPYFLTGVALAALLHVSNGLLGSQSPILMLPVAFLVYSGYHSYLGRLAAQKSHLEEMAALQSRTIEALALAIEAKEHAAHNHLRRLRLYSVEIGRELGLDGPELEALRAAAVLHDIGKLAVPEHILTKSGKLTREEFERIKIHPIVGAEILDRVNFPYPVSPIVRSHHEKWNGGGYPDGLKGENIPLGARILAAADCLDALISERLYRPAIALEEAIARIEAESGVSFDPKVVHVIQSRYQEFETRLLSEAPNPMHQSWRPPSPAAIGALNQPPTAPAPVASGFLDKIAEARQEAQVLLELAQQLGNSLHLDETLASLAGNLQRIVPFDTLVIYVLRDNKLVPRHATGEFAARLLARHIPLGQGLVGWVSRHAKPILNGNPSFEMGVSSQNVGGATHSGLAVHLPGTENTVGAILISRRGSSCFTKDHLRVLLALSAKLGVVVENALKYEQAAVSAATDFLTGLPNSRSLELHLESEISRASRSNEALTVLVCDLDGFKQINDQFGHIEGNSVLRAVADALRRSCREYDYVARMGGDEFVILLPGLQRKDVEQKLSQLNVAVRDAGLSVCSNSSLGISVGQARFPEDARTAEELLGLADQRMYDAKQLRKLRARKGPHGYDFDWLQSTPVQ